MHVGIEDKEEFVRRTFSTGFDLFKDPNTSLLVAQQNGDFIGHLSANIHPALHVNGYECMLRDMYVREDCRRKGVASSLMTTMERIFSARGGKRLSLASFMDDGIQGSLYSSLGYQKDAISQSNILANMYNKIFEWIDPQVQNPAYIFALLKQGTNDILLESTRVGKNGRFSYIALDPHTIVKSKGKDVWVMKLFSKLTPINSRDYTQKTLCAA